MSKIIDMYTRLPLRPDHKTYHERFEICEKNREEHGKCLCFICKEKHRVAAKLLKYGRKELVTFMNKEQERVYYSDLMEVFILAAKTLQNYLDKK